MGKAFKEFSPQMSRRTRIFCYVLQASSILEKAFLLFEIIREQIEQVAFCKIMWSTKNCQFCTAVSRIINFDNCKYCVKDSEFTRNFFKEKKCVPLQKYLKERPCELFWYFSVDMNEKS